MKIIALLLLAALPLSGCIAGASGQIGNGPVYVAGDQRANPLSATSLQPPMQPDQSTRTNRFDANPRCGYDSSGQVFIYEIDC